VAKVLIRHGADLHAKSPRGSQGTGPLLFSSYMENYDTSAARLLLQQGVDVNIEADDGTTALDWARARGNDELMKMLLDAGARDDGVKKNKAIPNNPVPNGPRQRATAIRASVQRAIEALQRGSEGFLNNRSVRGNGCVSCHHQTQPAVAFGWGRQRGYALDEAALGHQFETQLKQWRTRIEGSFNMRRPQPDAPVLLGYGLDALAAFRYPNDELTEAMVWYLHETQDPAGFWSAEDHRPPMEDGEIQGTALAIRALQVYPLPGREDESISRRVRAADWLAQAEAITFNQLAYQLMGLGWAGWPADQSAPLRQKILDLQREDGGWAQLPGLESDAWATGQALVALRVAGNRQVNHPAYRKGVDFLLRTQFEDGSWWVKTRTWPFQPHFDSDFAHGKDQWISSGGTTWAAQALMLTEQVEGAAGRGPRQRNAAAASLDWSRLDELAETARQRADQAKRAAEASAKRAVADGNAVDFVAQVKPLLERSCVNCHGGRRPKGGLDMTSRAGLIKGGKSEEASLVVGVGSRSPLVRFAADEVEDLEMPPLDKRDKYPKLTADELKLLKGWIDSGAAWPEGVVLEVD
jgi:hypothetical protein